MFEFALGDTRRPVNEVTLADWSSAVVALYKPALAGALLGVQPDPDDLRWRILRVNFDVLGLYAKALKIADLLAYQQAVEDACRTVRQLVEEEYPLGNEIYRDTSGIYFTFSDLDLPTDLEQEIRRRVENVEPELAPHIAVTVGDGATAQDQLKGILGKARGEGIKALKHPFDAHNFSTHWGQAWGNRRDEKKWEICPVCGLYPKLESDEVCEHCDKRRKSRLQTWQKNPKQTIWLGEIADHNDRVALLVGKFGLEGWLSGDLVQIMLVKAEPNNPGGCVSKNPSPARLRRVWETCEGFWKQTVEQEILTKKLANRSVRKLILPDKPDWQAGLYNGKVNGKPLDLFWQPEHHAFLTISNLQTAGELKPGDTVLLKQPEDKEEFEFRIQDMLEEVPNTFKAYDAYLPLLASPDQFLAFVPASDALAIVKKIQGEYENQFGKVRNRLPLHLGVVYFERKMPLMAVMDSARQMLQQPVHSEQWRVSSVDGNGQIKFENGITWHVPTMMGDGQTLDVWYPYWRVEGKPSGRARWFVGPDGEHWVHVNDLKNGDTVTLTPSTFDFLWLDAAARRFEVSYDDKGRRPARPTRPYYLEDLERLKQVWDAFSQLSRTQLKQTLQTIEATRERWFGPDELQKSAEDETFRQFVEDTLANAGLVSLRALLQAERGKQQSSPLPAAEVVNLFDAHILLFPVHSLAGPVWVSTATRLKEAGFTVDGAPQEDEQISLTWGRKERLNLGWLMLDVAEAQATVTAPDDWQGDAWDAVKGHIVLVTDTLFSQIVNSNLEVRTSVAINPETGAAEEHALYTYEAIPRATFLTAEVALDDYSADTNRARPFPTEKTGKNNPLPGGKWEGPLDVVRAGLKMIEILGVGGMGTRGFGRIKIIGEPVAKDPLAEISQEAQA